MLNYRYIRFLLQKQQQQDLNNEEEQLLEQWYQSLETMPATEITEQEQLKQQSWEQLHAIYSQSLPPARIIRWQHIVWPVAAATLLLVVGIRYLLPQRKPAAPVAWVTLECPIGKRLKMTMPDGSLVWLNSGSRMEYHPAFLQHRELRVVNGEVFFDVAADAAHPFLVNTRSLSVKVLGTSFNVSAYTQLKEEKVTVTSGSVQVLDRHRQQVILRPDEQLLYNQATTAFHKQAANAAETDSWRNGDIYLTNVSLEELALKLENIYGYQIIFSNPRLKHCINSLHFNDKEPVTNVLELLKLIDKINYTIRDKKIIISGQHC